MSDLFHVTSTRNRESIKQHGLDWARMRVARGIAGSTRPEVDGVFLCIDEHDLDYFVRLNNTGGPVDVWAVHGVEAEQLVESSNGYLYLPAPIPAECLDLVKEGLSQFLAASRVRRRVPIAATSRSPSTTGPFFATRWHTPGSADTAPNEIENQAHMTAA